MLLSPPELARLAAIATSRRSAAPGAPGGHRPGPHKGAGSQFAGHRAYTAGDDLRMIDWAAFARTDGVFVKEFREEVEGSLQALVDVSASMARGGKDLAARRAAAAAGAVALMLGDQARIVPFAKGRPIEPRGFAGLREIADLDRHLEGLESGGGPAGLAAARTILKARRGRVLYVSDLMEDEGAGPALIALRERGHAVTVAHVLSREETAPPEGFLRLRDSESGEVVEVLVDPETAAAYARVLEEFCGGWQTLCASHGMGYVRLLAGQPLSDWADSLC